MNEDVIMIVSGWGELQDTIDDLPHRSIADLTLCYFSMRKGKSGNSIDLHVIDNDEFKRRGFKNEEELYEIAASNTEAKFPLVISNWSSDISVISNDKNIFGATGIFYPGCLESVSEKAGGDILIIPSSIHEVLCIPADLADADDLRKMLYEANNDIVPEQDVLSYNIYYYDAAKNKLDVCMADENVV